MSARSSRRGTRGSSVRTVAVLAALAAVAGCGTTVRQTTVHASAIGGAGATQDATALSPADASAAATGVDTGGTSGPPLGAVPQASPISTSTARRAGTTAAPRGTSSRAGTTATSAPTRHTTARGPADVRGLDAKTILVGMAYANTQEVTAAQQQLGSSGATFGDAKGQQQALADYLNKRGGIRGRQIALVQSEYNAAGDIATESQAVCTNWTEDHAVYVGLGVSPGDSYGFVACMAKHKTLGVGSGDMAPGSHYQANADWIYTPSSVDVVAAARALVEGPLSLGYYGTNPRIGVLYLDTPDYRAGFESLKQTLATHRLTMTDSVGFSYSGLADIGRVTAEIGAAVLKFKADGITHVQAIDVSGALAQYFTQQADQQQYYPRYGLWTGSAPAYLTTTTSPKQLHGAVAVGWRPLEDVNEPPTNAAARTCDAIMLAAGFAPKSFADRTVQYSMCDQFFFLKLVVERATSFDPAGFRTAAESLGRAATIGAGTLYDVFGPGKHWGAGAYRLTQYGDSCNCFTYVSGDKPFS
jgi:hypothetical protein